MANLKLRIEALEAAKAEEETPKGGYPLAYFYGEITKEEAEKLSKLKPGLNWEEFYGGEISTISQ